MSLLNFFGGLFGAAKGTDNECVENPQSLWGIFKWHGPDNMRTLWHYNRLRRHQ